MVRVTTIGGLLVAGSLLIWTALTVMQLVAVQQLTSRDSAEMLDLRARVEAQARLIDMHTRVTEDLKRDLASRPAVDVAAPSNGDDSELRARIQEQLREISALKTQLDRAGSSDSAVVPGSTVGIDQALLRLTRVRKVAILHELALGNYIKDLRRQQAGPQAALDTVKRYNADLVMVDQVEEILRLPTFAEERKQRSSALKALVHDQLKHQQNPLTPCDKTRLLVCDLSKACGFGCIAHHLVMCLHMAHGTNRTLSLKYRNFRYTAKNGWNSLFVGLSSCDESADQAQSWSQAAEAQGVRVLHMPIIDMVQPPPPYLPNNMPLELFKLASVFHSAPTVWWTGQFAAYALKPNAEFRAYLDERKRANGWDPIVGVHVRRTDKIGTEAKFFAVPEYMVYVEAYFARHHPDATVRRVYIASDDVSVIEEAIRDYPQYTFLYDKEGAALAQSQSSRYGEEALRGIAADIALLSETEYLVCTFTSQVCRLAYELMQQHHVDAGLRFMSIDDPWYFGGGNREHAKSFASYKSDDPSHVSIEAGDMLQNHARYDNVGFMWKGENMRTKKVGLYPGYIVDQRTIDVKFPDYYADEIKGNPYLSFTANE